MAVAILCSSTDLEIDINLVMTSYINANFVHNLNTQWDQNRAGSESHRIWESFCFVKTQDLKLEIKHIGRNPRFDRILHNLKIFKLPVPGSNP